MLAFGRTSHRQRDKINLFFFLLQLNSPFDRSQLVIAAGTVMFMEIKERAQMCSGRLYIHLINVCLWTVKNL